MPCRLLTNTLSVINKDHVDCMHADQSVIVKVTLSNSHAPDVSSGTLEVSLWIYGHQSRYPKAWRETHKVSIQAAVQACLMLEMKPWKPSKCLEISILSGEKDVKSTLSHQQDSALLRATE